MEKLLKLTKDIRDESGDSDFFIEAGTIVRFISDEVDYVTAETSDKSIWFLLDPDEFEYA